MADGFWGRWRGTTRRVVAQWSRNGNALPLASRQRHYPAMRRGWRRRTGFGVICPQVRQRYGADEGRSSRSRRGAHGWMDRQVPHKAESVDGRESSEGTALMIWTSCGTRPGTCRACRWTRSRIRNARPRWNVQMAGPCRLAQGNLHVGSPRGAGHERGDARSFRRRASGTPTGRGEGGEMLPSPRRPADFRTRRGSPHPPRRGSRSAGRGAGGSRRPLPRSRRSPGSSRDPGRPR